MPSIHQTHIMQCIYAHINYTCVYLGVGSSASASAVAPQSSHPHSSLGRQCMNIVKSTIVIYQLSVHAMHILHVYSNRARVRAGAENKLIVYMTYNACRTCSYMTVCGYNQSALIRSAFIRKCTGVDRALYYSSVTLILWNICKTRHHNIYTCQKLNYLLIMCVHIILQWNI